MQNASRMLVFRDEQHGDAAVVHHPGGLTGQGLGCDRLGIAGHDLAGRAIRQSVEMTAQVAAMVVSPGLVLTRLERVHANKWVRYATYPAGSVSGQTRTTAWEQLRKVMKLHFVESMDEVLGIALESPLPQLEEETPEVLASVQPPAPEHRPHQ